MSVFGAARGGCWCRRRAFGADGAARAAWGEVPTLPRVVLRRTTPGRTPASWAPSSL